VPMRSYTRYNILKIIVSVPTSGRIQTEREVVLISEKRHGLNLVQEP
jgi:hypothetical protein